jgi:hypothetical protein
MTMISYKNTPCADNDSDFHSELSAVFQRLGVELIALTPKHWRSTVLELTGSDGWVTPRILSDEGHCDPIEPSIELLLHTYALERLLARQGRVWKSIQFHARVRPDESWSFGADYDYAA